VHHIQLKSITVLMCVYNGERFLAEQLESIHNQTCQPEEVIIYDDCSTDSSINIINQFINKYNLSSWKININKFRKGWRLNFYDAILNCKGDYIFFSDQDDIWYPEKISIMMETIQNNPNILVLTGFFKTIDINGRPVNVLDWTKNNIYNHKVIKSDIGETIFVWKHRIGCAMVIHKTIKEQLRHFIRDETFTHDIWALNIGALLGGCYHINYPVIQYRLHENNVSAKYTNKMLNRSERIHQLEEKIKFLEYIYNGVRLINNAIINQNEYQVFLKSISFYKFKLNSIIKFNFINVFRLISYIKIYFSYYNLKYFFIDFFEIFRLRDFARRIKRFGKNNNE